MKIFLSHKMSGLTEDFGDDFWSMEESPEICRINEHL